MKKLIYLIFSISLIIGLGSCGIGKYKTVPKPIKTTFTAVEIETLIEDDALNVRAIEIIDTVGLAYLTSEGKFGMYFNSDLPGYNAIKKVLPIQVKHDSIIPNFRALAVTSNKGYGLSIGSPALIGTILLIEIIKNTCCFLFYIKLYLLSKGYKLTKSIY